MADTQISRAAHWTGLIVGGIPALFLVVDAVMKLVKPEFVVKATTEFGYNENVIVPLGLVLLVSVALFFFPRTTVLGAILLTGYLGGAVATHVHHADGAFEILLPVVFGLMIWLGLWLCDTRVRQLVPIRS